jgi:hypothetical protein
MTHLFQSLEAWFAVHGITPGVLLICLGVILFLVLNFASGRTFPRQSEM